MMGIRATAPDWNIVLFTHGHMRGLPTPVRPVRHLSVCYAIVSEDLLVVEHDAFSSSRFCRLEVGAIPQHGPSYTHGLVGQSHRRHIRMAALFEFRNPAT